MSKQAHGQNFHVDGYASEVGTIEWFGTAEQAFAHAVERTTIKQHLHLVWDREGNIVLPTVLNP